MRGLLRLTVACVATALVTTGCGGYGGIYDLPLPGGASLGSHPFTVKADFTNVQDLVPQAAVMVNDVPVGRVTSIGLPHGGWNAEVTMKVNGGVKLPANAYARIAQSSLLGEKYVSLTAPPTGTASGALANGAVIPLSRTNRDPEVEEVFGALSLILNGGGLSQLHTITVELNKALGGNEPQIRDMLTQTTKLVSNLNAHRGDIVKALDGLNRLSANLRSRTGQIKNVLGSLSPGLKVLDQQRGELVTMLQALGRLSDVASGTIDKSRADTVADLNALAPILKNLSDAGDDLPRSLQVLLTYPFTDEVLNGVHGDYLNAYVSLTWQKGVYGLIPALPTPLPSSSDASAGGGN